MIEIIFEYILNNLPSLSAVVILIALACYIIRKFTKWEDKHDYGHTNIEHSLSRNQEEHTEILRRLDLLERFLIKNSSANYKDFSQTYSPIQLNPLGQKLFEESKAKDFFDEKKPALLRLLSTELGKLKTITALDVQDYAYRVCISISDNDDFKDIKDFIFLHPIYEEKTLSVGTICMLIGIELRNAYLELHPEINPD
jgi:hypothetical protein